MRLYDNDSYREEFMELVYFLLHSDGTNDRANQIIDAFDMAPEVDAEPLPPNDPLTLEQLREMDGEPVWIQSRYSGGWHILDYFGNDIVYMVGDDGYIKCNYGKTWLAYRRKKEEGTT